MCMIPRGAVTRGLSVVVLIAAGLGVGGCRSGLQSKGLRGAEGVPIWGYSGPITPAGVVGNNTTFNPLVMLDCDPASAQSFSVSFVVLGAVSNSVGPVTTISPVDIPQPANYINPTISIPTSSLSPDCRIVYWVRNVGLVGTASGVLTYRTGQSVR